MTIITNDAFRDAFTNCAFGFGGGVDYNYLFYQVKVRASDNSVISGNATAVVTAGANGVCNVVLTFTQLTSTGIPDHIYGSGYGIIGTISAVGGAGDFQGDVTSWSGGSTRVFTGTVSFVTTGTFEMSDNFRSAVAQLATRGTNLSNYGYSYLGLNGTLSLYDGAQPAIDAAITTQRLLATKTLSYPSFTRSAGANQIYLISPVATSAAIANGTATWFEFQVDPTYGLVGAYYRGSVGTTNADMIMSNPTTTIGVAATIDQFLISW